MPFGHLTNPCRYNIFQASYSHWYTQFPLMKTHSVLNKSNKCANVCFRKNQVFLYIFTINSQSGLTNFSTLFETFFKRNPIQNLIRFNGELFELEITEIFQNSYFY